jgi:hypothetical protein
MIQAGFHADTQRTSLQAALRNDGQGLTDIGVHDSGLS